MSRLFPFLLAAASASAAVPAAAQHGDTAGPDRGQAAVPVPLGRDRVRDLQQKLNMAGFSSGPVDGLWGPITSGALMNFQRRNGLQPSGTLTAETVRALDGVTATAARQQPPQEAAAQGTPGAVVEEAPSAPGSADQPSPISPARAPLAPAPAASVGADTGAASPAPGESNPTPPAQAADAGRAQPAAGANSFTSSEAQHRIARQGFGNVSNLRMDSDGVWHGKATKDKRRVDVWLDYKGNVGQL